MSEMRSSVIWLVRGATVKEDEIMALCDNDSVKAHVRNYSKPGFIVTVGTTVVSIVNIDEPNLFLVFERITDA